MTRAVLAPALAAVVLAAVLAGCSSDDGPSGSPAPAPSETATEPTPSEPAPPAEDPITFGSSGETCVEIKIQDLLVSERMTLTRPLTLDGVELQGSTGSIELGEATYVAVPQGAVPLTGGWAGTAPAKKDWDQTGWRDREPVVGAAVPPGDYYLYLPLTITGTGGYDGIDVAWTEAADAGAGSSTWDTKDAYREKCT